MLTPFLNLQIQRKLISVPPCRLPSCAEVIHVWPLQYFRYFGPSSSAAAKGARSHDCCRRHWRRNFATCVCLGPADSGIGGGAIPPLLPPTSAARLCHLRPPLRAAVVRADQAEPGLTGALCCRSLSAAAPRAVLMLIIKHLCNPKSVFCCISIAIQLQAGWGTQNRMQGICLTYAWFRNQTFSKTQKGYAMHIMMPGIRQILWKII